jgi:tetratricopeptide (TPR) repeat protein
LALCRALGGQRGIVSALGKLGLVACWQRDYDRAAALLEEGQALARELGDRRGIAWGLIDLGNVAYGQRQYVRAAALYEEGLALFREVGDKHGIAYSLIDLGGLRYRQGDYGLAAALLHEALMLSRDIETREAMAESLESLAWVAVAVGQSDRSAWLGGSTEALREALGMPLRPVPQADHDQAVQTMRAALGEEAFAAAWVAGRGMTLEAAIAYALEVEPARAQ